MFKIWVLLSRTCTNKEITYPKMCSIPGWVCIHMYSWLSVWPSESPSDSVPL